MLNRLLRKKPVPTNEVPPSPPPPRTDEEQAEYIAGLERAFTPNASHERTTDELDFKQMENWSRVAPDVRELCIQLLNEEVPPRFKAKWQDQAERDVSIGSDDNWFHFGLGMSIRNLLRRRVADTYLPPVDYGDGRSYSNWDDFYVGALYDFVS